MSDKPLSPEQFARYEEPAVKPPPAAQEAWVEGPGETLLVVECVATNPEAVALKFYLEPGGGAERLDLGMYIVPNGAESVVAKVAARMLMTVPPPDRRIPR